MFWFISGCRTKHPDGAAQHTDLPCSHWSEIWTGSAQEAALCSWKSAGEAQAAGTAAQSPRISPGKPQFIENIHIKR